MTTLNQAQQAIAMHQHRFQPDFSEWIESNWHIYEYFESAANQVWDKGGRKFGARCIAEVMRYKTAIREIGDGSWKINNSRVPCLARLYMTLHPEREGFFAERDHVSVEDIGMAA